MSNHKNLIWFNKEGDYLNFKYEEETEKFTGDILMHESSSDTYKTYGLYMFERIPSFEYELVGNLSTSKFQLFNEYSIDFYGSNYMAQSILKIEPTNNDPNFYSKWIYGIDFESKFPIGSLVKFDSVFLEFTDTNRAYSVVSSKKGAIMIISSIDNNTFENDYQSIYTNPINFTNLKISGVNAIGVYNYIDTTLFNTNLSPWNETDFYDKYFIGRKLNVFNSFYNDNVYSVNNILIPDINHFEYFVSDSQLPEFSDIIIEVITRTDIPKIYEGSIIIDNNSIINIDPNLYPSILKPGREFKIVGSTLNTNFLTVKNILNWNGITSQTFFATQSQVIYNNKIYECVLAYTQSFGSQSTSYINPENTTYWTNKPTYVQVDQSTISESINGQVYLTSDRYYFTQNWNTSETITLASAADRYREDLNIFNIDLYYSSGILKADLKYPSLYANVNFYHSVVGNTYSIGTFSKTVERLVGVTGSLVQELNNDKSENFYYNIVFTDIDEYGIKIIINGMTYEEEVAWVHTGFVIDLERTIDKTLRNWLTRNYVILYTLGIQAELQYIGNYNSLFYNSIRFKTEYPNVPFTFNDVLVGTTGNFYIEHSKILFSDIGPYLNININGADYGLTSSFLGITNITDVALTLERWVSEYYNTLLLYNIEVSAINSLLSINIKDPQQRVDYTINTGKLIQPGNNDFTINKRIKGNLGVVISSNEIILTGTYSSDSNFEKSGFATGMVLSINNTMWPLVNQEYNIQYIEPNIMNISYEGPFWGLTDSICNSSAFITLAYDTGFSLTACAGPTGPTSTGGNFYPPMFDPSMFDIGYQPNNYDVTETNLSIYSGTNNFIDLKYLNLTESIYILGDYVTVLDAISNEYLKTIPLSGNTQSIKMEFNTVNNYLYCLSLNKIYIIDPLFNNLISTIGLTNSAYDIGINSYNGDVFVTYTNSINIDIWSEDNISSTPTVTINSLSANWPVALPIITRCGKISFTNYDNSIFITTNGDKLIKINSSRIITTTFAITGLAYPLFYEPMEDSIYSFGDLGMFKINGDDIENIPLSVTASFIDLVYNPFGNEVIISDKSENLSKVEIESSNIITNNISSYGYMAISQFDGGTYLTSQTTNNILIINPLTGTIETMLGVLSMATKVIYNPQRRTILAIEPIVNSIVEVMVTINSTITPINLGTQSVDENLYGTLDPNYEPRPSIWLKTRDYIRKPRENFEGDINVKYYWKWEDMTKEEFFLYDFSGEQLEKTGSYSYIGPKPLTEVVLNKNPNRDINRISIPEYQQTIFDKIEYTLSYIDDSDDISTEPEPLQTFIGFKSEYEGAYSSILKLYKNEEISIDIISNETTNLTLKMFDDIDGRRGQISINNGSNETFSNKGLKPGQLIVLYLKDLDNKQNQYVSDNNASIFKIKSVFTKSIVLDFLTNTDFIVDEETTIQNYPSIGNTTYLKLTIKVKDKEIGSFNVYGQTEEEDERFKIELGNIGKLIDPEEVFIFKEYDILEGGIDWTILNRKRKEMLMMKHLIYPYIGSYKSIINAINYFGYNDLQLNEYYRNIDPNSENFLKLFKVEIPNIFDNTIEGWDENDFIKNTYPNENYEETNSFNLTYFITDKGGENLNTYSLDEIIIKIQGLKYWLKKNIIPLTHKILDITGQSYINSEYSIQHKLCDVKIYNIRQNMTPISFKLNEAYLMPINSGSTVYNCVIDFYSIIPGLGASYSQYIEKPKAYNGVELVSPDSFDIKIRTYKTYKEWEPFTTYNIGDKVKYFDNIYKSVIPSNKTKNPRKYESATPWSPNTTYQVSTIVEYNRNFYVYSGLSATQSNTYPNLDTLNWLKITEWEKIDYEPVQTINEFRSGDDLLPYNFTIDSNIDPFVVIEVTSDNGYGEIYKDKKNYEIKGLNDLGIMSVTQISGLPKLSTPLVII